MIFPKNLTSMLTRVQNLTTMLVTTVLHRTVRKYYLKIHITVRQPYEIGRVSQSGFSFLLWQQHVYAMVTEFKVFTFRVYYNNFGGLRNE